MGKLLFLACFHALIELEDHFLDLLGSCSDLVRVRFDVVYFTGYCTLDPFGSLVQVDTCIRTAISHFYLQSISKDDRL